jgi:hypothetical protein
MGMLRQLREIGLLVASDAVENVKSTCREDDADEANLKAIRFGQQFAASMPRLHKTVGTKRMSDSKPSEEHEDGVGQQLSPHFASPASAVQRL